MLQISFRFLICILTLSSFSSFAQLKLKVGESFLSGLQIKKVFVSIEDHAVWALTNSGTVYLKKSNEIDFTIYNLTNGLLVNEITGYNENEMYFLIKPDIIVNFKNGLRNDIKVPLAEVTRINNISVVHARKNIEYYTNYPQITNEDFLAIATNKHMYKLYRNGITEIVQQPYANPPIVNEPEWKISNTGYKSVDFRYTYPLGQCVSTNLTTINYIAGTTYISEIPDRPPYPSKVNATLFAHNWQQPYIVGSSWQLIYNLWGTDDGLYVKSNLCAFPEIKKVLSEKINDLEEIYALTPIHKQNFVLAATENGIYYTQKSIFQEFGIGNNDLAPFNFLKLESFPSESIQSICMDTNEGVSYNLGSGYSYDTMCEKIAWVASSNGLRKIYVSLDQEYYDQFKFDDFITSNAPSNNGDNTKKVFETCGNQTISITPRIPEKFGNQLLFQWFKDDEEISNWIGKRSVELKESGIYTAKITSLCENITLNSIPFIIKNNTAPEITFEYPKEVNICPSSKYTLQTKLVNGYSYRWLKDNILIQNATSNIYQAETPGEYHVEVSNCGTYFEKSNSIKINQTNIPLPIITTKKSNYCLGETAVLNTENPNNYKLKWYLNGNEIIDTSDKTEISAVNPGNYKVVFYDGVNCERSSTTFPLIFNSLPNVKISLSSNNTICFGNEITLTASTNSVNSNFLWNTGETTPSIKINRSGKYNVKVINEYGCISISEEINITVNAPIELITPEDKQICVLKGEYIILEADKGFISYTWNNDKTTNPFFKVEKPGTYSLIVEDIYGCKAKTNYIVNPYCKEIYAPNAFSPNDDGVNDLWQVTGLENDPTAKISIFNRLGVVIYKTSGNAPYWNGKLKDNSLATGVYYYTIHTKNSIKPVSGSLIIIK